MVAATDQDDARGRLLLEVALEAQVLVARLQHLRVQRTVRVVARDAAFARGLVLEHIGTTLRSVAFHAGAVHAAKVRAALGDRITGVRAVAIAAAHLAGEHRMGVRQAELTALVEMALEARVGRCPRIHDRACATTLLDVNRARPVTRFATDLRAVAAGSEQLSVRRVVKFRREVFVALRALLGADKSGARDLRRSDQRSVDHHTADKEEPPDGGPSEYYSAFGPTRMNAHGLGGFGSWLFVGRGMQVKIFSDLPSVPDARRNDSAYLAEI